LRTPDLWTVTARTKEQDALCIALRIISDRRRCGLPVRATAEEIAPLCGKAKDRGDPSNRNHVHELSIGLSRMQRAIRRQFTRQQTEGYRESRWAGVLKHQYATAYPLRWRLGAAWRVSIKEAGELNGRLHAHVASDFDFIHHGWLSAVALRCGLGFVHYRRKASAALRRTGNWREGSGT